MNNDGVTQSISDLMKQTTAQYIKNSYDLKQHNRKVMNECLSKMGAERLDQDEYFFTEEEYTKVKVDLSTNTCKITPVKSGVSIKIV